MHAQENWGEEKNAWLVDISYGTAIVAGILFTITLAFIFRVPLLRIVAVPFRPLAFIPAWMKLLILATPLKQPLRRYVYTPRHLQEA